MTDVVKVKRKRIRITKVVATNKKNTTTDDRSDTGAEEGCKVTSDKIDLVTPDSSFISPPDECERVTLNTTTDCIECIPNETVSPEKSVAVAPDKGNIIVPDREGLEEMYVSTNS